MASHDYPDESGIPYVPSGPAALKDLEEYLDRWVIIDGVGGYVCAAPTPGYPDGICGMPTESEPCPEHGQPWE